MAEFLQSWIAGLVGHPVPPINSLTFWGDYAKAISESPYVRFSDLYYLGAYTGLWLVIFYAFQSFVSKAFMELLPGTSPQPKENGGRKDAKLAPIAAATSDVKPTLNKQKRGSVRHKFATALWKASSFTFTALLGSAVFFTKEWSTNPGLWWRDFDIDWDVRHFYLFDLAFWIHTCIVFKFEPVLRDRNQMWFHHFVTIYLIVNSYTMGHCQVGLAIMILHDLSDPLMETARLFNYQGKELGANVFFILFMVAFFFLRLFVYPMHVLHSVFVVFSDPNGPEIFQSHDGYWLFVVLLGSLQVLHIFWAFLIGKIAVTSILSGGVKGDVREE